jgi:Tol biopolymer transport system component
LDPPLTISLIDNYPSWSPDGKLIAYCHSDAIIEKNGIYLIQPDGTGNRLWQQGTFETPNWSPDGQWIIFSKSGQLWGKKLNGDSLTSFTSNGKHFYPSWSPDGKKIAYMQTICDENKCGIWSFTIKESTNAFLVPYGMFPAYNPAKEEIFYLKRWVEKDGRVLGDSVFSFNYGSQEKKFVVSLQNPNYDNRFIKIDYFGKILFISQSNDKNAIPDLWLMNNDGGNRVKFLSQVCSANWNPTGNKIVYTDCHTSSGRLWIINLDGSNKYPLTSDKQY